MRRGADSRRSEVHFPVVCFQVLNEFRNGRCGDSRADEEKIWEADEQRDRLKVAFDIKRQTFVEEGIDRMGARRSEEQRVSVGRRLCRIAGTDTAAGARS